MGTERGTGSKIARECKGGRTLFWTDRPCAILWTSDCAEEDGVGVSGGIKGFVC